MSTTHARLFGSHELNQREFFGLGFQRLRSPSPRLKTNPISWDPCPCGASPTPQSRRAVSRMSMYCTQLANGPYAYSPPRSEADSFYSAPSFLGARKKRVAEPQPEPGVVSLLSPNTCTRGIREQPKVASLPFQSPRLSMENEEKLRASRGSQKTRRNFPEKSATCGVKLGLQNGSPRKIALPNDMVAFDSAYKDQHGQFQEQRARFFSNNSTSFVARKKHFTDIPDNTESVASIIYQQDNFQDASSNGMKSCLDEHSAIAPGRKQSFMPPHRVSQRGKVVEQAEPSKCANFRSTTDLDFWKQSKHMMKKMFHEDPTLTARKTISSGLEMMDAPLSMRKSVTTNHHFHLRGSKPDREYSMASLTEILTNALRQRQRAASHKLVWKP
eukprot:GEMP01016627.1.p1 GENE.GEMP01016627.1~~GEMP01016627.1.p1  ORF type:complete len:386 (+),score=72.83 GEMP01016627.1:189-1346(+)